MVARTEIVLKESVKKVEKLVKKDGDEVVGAVEGILKKIFLGLDVGVLEKKIIELKTREQTGTLSDNDKKALPRLLKVFESRKSDIEDKVENLFKRVVDGTTILTDAQIKSNAAQLIDEVGGSSTLTVARRNKLIEIAKDGLVVARKVKNSGGMIVDKKEAAGWVYQQTSGKEVIESEKRGDKLNELKDIVVGITDNFENMTASQLAESISEENRLSSVRREKTEKLLKMETTQRDALKGGMNVKDGELVEMLGSADFKDNPIFKMIRAKLDGGRGLDPREKRILHEFSGQLIDLQLSLRNKMWDGVIDGVPGLNMGAFGRTRFVMAGVEVETSIGSLKKRLRDAFRLIDFDVIDTEDIEEQRRLLLATGITQTQAESIWNNVQEWGEEYGNFSKGVDQLRSESFRAEDIKTKKDESFENDIRDMRGENKQMKWHQLIERYDADGKPVYSEEGKRRMQQLEKISVMFERAGEDKDGSPTWRMKENTLKDFGEEMDRMKDTLPQDMQEEMERARREMMQKLQGLGAPEERQEYLKEEIERQVMQIYDTGDASRAPGNQMASYRLYMYMGMLPGDIDFKTTWMSRLAIYDVKMFMSGVENYEEWAKVNSFLPIEFRSYLHKDEMSIGKILDQNGDEKELRLNFAEIFSMYEEQDGSSNDLRDIWIARLLGAKNMDEVSLAKKQIMAAYLGKQMGIRFKYEMVGGQEMFRQIGNDKLKFNGKETNLLALVGLDENGMRLAEDLRGEVDLQGQYGWYMDMPVDLGHLDLRWVGLERGGTKGDWWPQQMNGLRKLHGLSQKDYHKRKQMGMESAVDEMDSGWRSWLSWKLFETHRGADKTVFWQNVEQKLEETGAHGKKGNFFNFLKQALYLPEYWENGTVCGELRSIAEVRGLLGDELNKVRAKYVEFDSGNNYDWSSILGLMGVDTQGANVVGQAGMKVFLENFSLHKLITYDGIPHNLVADHIKYTGYAEGYWKASVKAGDAIWDMKVQKELVEAVKSYYGKKGGEWKSNRLFQRQVLNGAMSDLEGQATYMNKDGVEITELWKITADSPTGDTAEVAKRGWRIDREGYVVDENNIYQYRPGKIGYWEGFLDPNKPWSQGSAAARHGLPITNWKTAKEILKGYLKSRMLTPEQYWKEKKRFNYAMYLDVKIPVNEKPGLVIALRMLAKKPWKIARLPYTILRGIAVDLGLEPEDAVAFFSPLGKELSKQFSNI
ncbi:MAG: hypothetical protein ABII21_03835 [bacterium]